MLSRDLAATGVVVPLVLMCALMLVASAIHRQIVAGTTQRAIVISGRLLRCVKSSRNILNPCKNHVGADRSEET